MHEKGWRPPYAYIPGQTTRHPEDLFDLIKTDTSVPDGGAVCHGLAFLRDEFYWEAHEVLEAVWVECPKNSVSQVLVQSLIQLANAGLKLRMDRPKAAERLIAMADRLWREGSVRIDCSSDFQLLQRATSVKVLVEAQYNARIQQYSSKNVS